MTDEKWFPVTPPMTDKQAAKSGPSPARIPWSIAEKAYSVYVGRYGRGQSMQRIAERGGFYAEELDDLYPGWRTEASDLTALRAEVERLKADVRTWAIYCFQQHGDDAHLYNGLADLAGMGHQEEGAGR